MPQHTVKKGESLWLIAKNNKLSDWKLIYDDPKNAAFRKKHPDPNLIFPGEKVFVPPKKPNKNSKAGGTSQAHAFKVPSCGGVHNLKWEPAKGTFGQVKSAKLTGDSDLPEGTELIFAFLDRSEQKLELPELKGKVQGKKVSIEWDLGELNGNPEIYLLDVATYLKDRFSANVATLSLEDRRCTAKEIKVQPFLLQQQQKKQQQEGRRPNSDGLIQFVAEASMKWNTEAANNFKSTPGKDAKEAIDRSRKVHDMRRKYGGFKNVPNFVKDYQKKRWGKQSDTRAFKFTAAYCHGGEAELDAQLSMTGSCQKDHTFKVEGPVAKALKPKGDTLKLPWNGTNALPSNDIKPTLYTLVGKGCEGNERKVTVEVYPSNQIAFSAGFDSSGFTKLANCINDVLKLTGFGGFALSFSLAGFGFFGWREEPDDGDWRVFYAREFGVSGGVKLSLSLRVSFISIFTGIPPSALKYFADIGLTIGIELALSLKYSREEKLYPPTAKTPPKTESKAGFEAAGSAHLGVYARIGPGDLLSVEAVGKASAGLKYSCQPLYQSQKFFLKDSKLEMTPVDFTITITTSLLLVKSEHEWKFTWYKPDPNKPLYQNKMYELFDFSKKYDGNAITSGSNVG